MTALADHPAVAAPVAGAATDAVVRLLKERVPWAIVGEPFTTQLLGAGPFPKQGWKLHVSASVTSAADVLRRVLPVLLASGSRFKVVSSVDCLTALNGGQYGQSQVGKFVTVYPSDGESAVALGDALHAATVGLTGPRVPTDRQLRPGSLVHYRYGAFVANEAAPGFDLDDPCGRLAIDVRGAHYRPPFPGLADPFEAAGSYVAPPTRRGAIGGRYLVHELLLRTWRGGVYRAIDAGSRPARVCLLKEIWCDIGGTQDGEAFSWADNEYAVLSDHGSDPFLPRLYDRFTMEGNGYLVTEYVEGESLDAELAGRPDDCQPLPVERLFEIAQASARILGHLHDAGLVFRDFKPEHLLHHPDGSWRLVDFGVAHDLLSGRRPVTAAGTPPWAGPEQWSGAAPDPSHDVFSWGAVMHWLACGNDSIPEAPASGPLRPYRRAPVAERAPLFPPRLAAVIDRAVSWDVSRRYQSMGAVLADLRALPERPDAASGVLVPPRRSRPGRLDPHPLDLARKVGDAVCDSGQEHAGGVRWAAAAALDSQPPTPDFPPDVYDGAAGIAIFLAQLAGATGDARYAEAARAAGRWLAGPTWASGRAMAGLHCGQAGIGVSFLHLAKSLGDPGYITAAELVARRLDGVAPQTVDLFSGSAGTVAFLVDLAEATGDRAYLSQARREADVLLRTVKRPAHGRGVYWNVACPDPSIGPLPYLGMAHGVAGIGMALAELARATGDGAALDLARDAAELLLERAVEVSGGGWTWPRLVGDTTEGLQAWCHGAGGIGSFFLRLHRLVPDDRYREGVRRASITITRHARTRSRSGLCCGLAGDGSFLLDCHAFLGDDACLAAAWYCAGRMEDVSVVGRPGVYRVSSGRDMVSPDLMLGAAGVGAFFLRLADPVSRPERLLP